MFGAVVCAPEFALSVAVGDGGVNHRVCCFSVAVMLAMRVAVMAVVSQVGVALLVARATVMAANAAFPDCPLCSPYLFVSIIRLSWYLLPRKHP